MLYRKSLFIVLLFFFLYGILQSQNINYTNQAIQIVDKIEEPGAKAPKEWEVHGSWTSQLRYYNVTGDGQGSLKDQGVFHSHALNLSLEGEIGNNVFFRGNVAGSFDDQESSSDNKFRLDNLLLEFYQPNLFSVQFGDVSPSLSYYTLQQTLEGFNGYYNIELADKQAVVLSGVVGQIPRDFHGGPRRMVYAYRMEGREFLPGLIMGIDQVFIDDHEREAGLQDVSVFSFNGRWELPVLKGLEWYWDLAHSFNLQDNGDNEPAKQDGWGIRTGLSYAPDEKGRYLIEFEQNSYDFTSPVAAGAPDRRTLRVQGNRQLLENLQLVGSYNYHEDNLSNTLQSTTRSHQTNWDLQYQPFKNAEEEYLANLNLTQTLGFTKRYDKNNFESNIWDMMWSASNRYQDFSLQISYTVSVVDERIAENSDSQTHALQTRLGYSHKFMEDNLSIDTGIYIRYSDQLLKKDRREHTISRIYGWNFLANLYEHYELSSNVEYQRLTKAGNSYEGEVYLFKMEARYSYNLPKGQIKAGMLLEYNAYNYMKKAEEFDELRLMANFSYIF